MGRTYITKDVYNSLARDVEGKTPEWMILNSYDIGHATYQKIVLLCKCKTVQSIYDLPSYIGENLKSFAADRLEMRQNKAKPESEQEAQADVDRTADMLFLAGTVDRIGAAMLDELRQLNAMQASIDRKLETLLQWANS